MTTTLPIEPARNGSLAGVFDHVVIAVADLAASERFYRTVLSVLGAEPIHADAELVEWEDWDIGPADREHPVTRGLHVGFRAPSREAVDAFWQAGIDAGYRDDGAPGPRSLWPGLLPLPARPRWQQRGGGAQGRRGPRARRLRRPPHDPRPRPRRVQALLHDDRPARRAADRRGPA